MKDFSTVMALLVGGIIISMYKYDYIENPDTSNDYKPYIDPMAN